jgi:hypothetical protein
MESFKHQENLIMHRLLILYLLVIISSTSLISQTIFDFEEWKSTFRELPNETEVPNQVTTSNDLYSYWGLGVNKSKLSHTGMHCVSLESGRVFGEYFTNSIAIGNYKSNFIEGNYDRGTGGLALEGNDINIDFWSKVDTLSLEDEYEVSLSIRRGNEFVIIDSIFKFLPTKEWSKNRIRFNYDYKVNDSLIVIFHSIKENTGVKLFFDDISIHSILSEVSDYSSDHTFIYPTIVSNESVITVVTKEILNISKYAIYSLNGHLLHQSTIDSNIIYLPYLNTGNYLIKMNDKYFRIMIVK